MLRIFFNGFHVSQTSPVSQLYSLYWVRQSGFFLKNSFINVLSHTFFFNWSNPSPAGDLLKIRNTTKKKKKTPQTSKN